MSFNLLKIVRVHAWWNYIVPPILAAVYVTLLINNLMFYRALLVTGLFLMSITGTAIFGFAINDIADIVPDAAAGKPNRMAGVSRIQRILILFAGLFLAVIPWLFLRFSAIALALFILQIILLTIYAVKPFRLKEHIYASIVCDSLYSGLIFVLVVLFSQLQQPVIQKGVILLCAVILMLLLRGIRNFLVHQVLDETNDRKSNITTYVTRYGHDLSLKIIKHVLLPAELLVIAAFVILMSLIFEYFWLIVPASLLYYLLKRFDIKKAENMFHIQLINDFYEDMVPLFLLTYLTLADVRFMAIALVHILIFRNKVVWIVGEKVIYGFIYRKVILWFYYKMFHNRFVKNIFQKNE